MDTAKPTEEEMRIAEQNQRDYEAWEHEEREYWARARAMGWE